jgi:hypothetical protein
MCAPFSVYVFGLSGSKNQGAENGVQNVSLWRVLLGVENAVVEDIELDDERVCWWRMSGRGD